MNERYLERVVTHQAPLANREALHREIAVALATKLEDFKLPAGYNIGMIEYKAGAETPPPCHLLIALSSESMNLEQLEDEEKEKLQEIINELNDEYKEREIMIRLANNPQRTATRHGYGEPRQYPDVLEEEHKRHNYLIDKNSQPIKLYYINNEFKKEEKKLTHAQQQNFRRLTKKYRHTRTPEEKKALRDLLFEVTKEQDAKSAFIHERESVGSNTYLIDRSCPSDEQA